MFSTEVSRISPLNYKREGGLLEQFNLHHRRKVRNNRYPALPYLQRDPKMKIFNFLSSVALIASTVSAQLSFTASGTGCPTGSVGAGGPVDQHAITVFYGDFLPFVGTGSTPTDRVKTCLMTFRLTCNPANSHTFDVINRGYVSLLAGMSATIGVQVVYPDFVTRTASVTINGYKEDTFTIPYPTLNRAFPCGTNLQFQVLTSVILNPGSSTGDAFVSYESFDAGINII